MKTYFIDENGNQTDKPNVFGWEIPEEPENTDSEWYLTVHDRYKKAYKKWLSSWKGEVLTKEFKVGEYVFHIDSGMPLIIDAIQDNSIYCGEIAFNLQEISHYNNGQEVELVGYMEEHIAIPCNAGSEWQPVEVPEKEIWSDEAMNTYRNSEYYHFGESLKSRTIKAKVQPLNK